VKGGSGTTVVSVALASGFAEASPAGALVVDLAGDVPAVVGLPEPQGPGVEGWLAAGSAVPADALTRLELAGPGRLRVLAKGEPEGGGAEVPEARATVLAALLAADPRPVVVDCGAGADGAGPAVVAAATTSLLVLRPCYLSLRRAQQLGVRASGIVLVGAGGRSLRPDDVEAVLDVPVVASVDDDPQVARVVDAGLLGHRVPRALRRSLRHVV
jgi:CO dehydrogenase nickel-insertion accessory protein CooC1